MRRQLELQIAPITDTELIVAPAIADKLFHATQRIVTRGVYTNPEGIDISIQALQDASRQGQRNFESTAHIDDEGGRYVHTHTFVYNQTTLAVAHERVRQGYHVTVMNFANPIARVHAHRLNHMYQEASLWRSSSLAYCMPEVSWRTEGPIYDDTVIVTPKVPVFRTHGGDLLAVPWQCGVVHALAIDFHGVRQSLPMREADVVSLMIQRAQRVLRAAATTRANVLVLGAWGCGQAGHDPDVMAAIWRVAIEQANLRMFGIIDFAVPDTDKSQARFRAFHKIFHQWHFSRSE